MGPAPATLADLEGEPGRRSSATHGEDDGNAVLGENLAGFYPEASGNELLEGNPALVTLETLQTASAGKNTLVLGLSQPIVPIGRDEKIEGDRSPRPLKPRTEDEPPGAED